MLQVTSNPSKDICPNPKCQVLEDKYFVGEGVVDPTLLVGIMEGSG